jgi:hypothetical protein
MDRNITKDIKRDDSKDWSSQQYPQSSPPTNLGTDDMKCRELTGSHEASETEKRRSPTLGFLEVEKQFHNSQRDKLEADIWIRRRGWDWHWHEISTKLNKTSMNSPAISRDGTMRSIYFPK